MYYVYFIKSKKHNETYVGSTNDLHRRLSEHNNGTEISTRRYKPWQLVYYEAYQSEKDAREREMKLKSHGNAVRELKKRIQGSLKNGAGFTLVEILIALVILSMGIGMLITMFTVGLKGVTANQVRTQATNLAQDLMDEIMGKEFRDPQDPDWGIDDGEVQGDRTTYDDVDDYSAWKNKKPPEDVIGTSLTTYADFTRSVSVFFVDGSLTAQSEESNMSIKEIIVCVEHSDIATVSLYGLKTLSVYQ